jgi:hypothetical protein
VINGVIEKLHLGTVNEIFRNGGHCSVCEWMWWSVCVFFAVRSVFVKHGLSNCALNDTTRHYRVAPKKYIHILTWEILKSVYFFGLLCINLGLTVCVCIELNYCNIQCYFIHTLARLNVRLVLQFRYAPDTYRPFTTLVQYPTLPDRNTDTHHME